MPRVFIPAQLRDVAGGQSELDIQGTTVGELVSSIDRQYPGFAARISVNDDLSPALQLSIDGTFTSRGLDARVSPTSEIHFLPVFGGG